MQYIFDDSDSDSDDEIFTNEQLKKLDDDVCDILALTFISELYTYPDVTQNRLQTIFERSEMMYYSKLQSLENYIEIRLQKLKCSQLCYTHYQQLEG